MKYARKDPSGRWMDVQTAPSSLYASLSDLEKKTGVTGYVQVADDVENGAIDNGDGTHTNPAPVGTQPTPHNPGNPYFGKKPKTGGEFWGHLQAVYIARAIGAQVAKEDGLDRLYRLRSSRRAAGVLETIRASNVIDPDDIGGDFLQCVGLLTTTRHEDGELLMETAERDAIMAAWD